MDDQTGAPGETGSGSPSPSRRTVLRTAAHAAWAVPAIQFLGTAPAFAASGAIGALTFTALAGTWALAADRMSATISVLSSGGVAPTANLQVTVGFSNLYVYDGRRTRNLRITNVTGPWRASRVTYSGSGASRTATVTFTARTQVAPGGTSTLGFSAQVGYNITSSGAADTVTVAATATLFTGTSSTINPT